MRGIPRQVVQANLPIAGSRFHAADAADTTSPCPWDEGNWGVKDNAAGQAYYDSMLKLYAAWGVDFLKVDCIATNPYRPTEIRQIAEAIRKTGRPIVLSLSPGPTALDHAAEVQKYAQMWRISNDHWDGWTFPAAKPGDEFPFGLQGASTAWRSGSLIRGRAAGPTPTCSRRVGWDRAPAWVPRASRV